MALLLYFLGGWSLFVLFILLQPQPNRSAHYYAILNEFLDVVAAQLFGHLHSDEFRAFGNSTFLLPILSLALSRSLSLSLSRIVALSVSLSLSRSRCRSLVLPLALLPLPLLYRILFFVSFYLLTPIDIHTSDARRCGFKLPSRYSRVWPAANVHVWCSHSCIPQQPFV